MTPYITSNVKPSPAFLNVIPQKQNICVDNSSQIDPSIVDRIGFTLAKDIKALYSPDAVAWRKPLTRRVAPVIITVLHSI
jgi:hypothetical protein